MSTPRRIASAALLLLALAGCGVLPTKEPMQIIASQAQVAPDPSWPQVAWQLNVMRPNAAEILDSRRLAVVPAPGQIQVYKGVSWDDTLPDIVQDTLVHAFEDSGKILAAAHQNNGLRTDFTLQLEIRDAQAVYRTPAGPPEIDLVITAKLIDSNTSRALASHTFRQAVPAGGTAVPQVAQAFDTALGTNVHDIVGWTLVSGEQARAAAKR